MDVATLEYFIRGYFAAHPSGEVFFTWQGGEPTMMGKPFFEEVVRLQEKYCPKTHTYKNAFQTNGHLLNDDWAKFLKVNDFLVGISMDGPPDLHNAHRKTHAGIGTHAATLRGLNALKKRNVDVNILACVSDANVHAPLEIYRYFRDDLAVEHIQYIPIVERINKTGNQRGEKLSSRTISGGEYGAFLTAIFDEWLSRDVGSVFVQLFEACLGVWFGLPASICIFSETCGACLALEHTGDLYSCDHYVQPDAHLGSVSDTGMDEMVNSEQQVKFGYDKRDRLPDTCLRCDVRFMCNGGCPKNRVHTPKGEPYPLNHLCAGYKTFFRHIDEPMRLMAALLQAKRPASDVMNIHNNSGK